MILPGIPEIETMDRAALIAAWSSLFDTPVPKSLSQPFLRRFISFEVQARVRGGLPKSFVKDLGRRGASSNAHRAANLQPGGRLLREWNGVTHIVEVTDDGFLWNKQLFRSLSSVARAITGARWSGPRFFGLKDGAA